MPGKPTPASSFDPRSQYSRLGIVSDVFGRRTLRGRTLPHEERGDCFQQWLSGCRGDVGAEGHEEAAGSFSDFVDPSSDLDGIANRQRSVPGEALVNVNEDTGEGADPIISEEMRRNNEQQRTGITRRRTMLPSIWRIAGRRHVLGNLLRGDPHRIGTVCGSNHLFKTHR